MKAKYHVVVTKNAVGKFFDSTALNQIIQANVTQDALVNLLGSKHHFHFDNNKIAESLAYVDSEHNQIIALADKSYTGAAQRAAFGRLCHAVQDFYSHSNYIDLWLEKSGGLSNTKPNDINGLDPDLLNHPDLLTGNFIIWRDIIYYIPIISRLVRRIYIPQNSHEYMNLDSPAKGVEFYYSLVAAQQRTSYEYNRIIQDITEASGQMAIYRFHNAL